MRARDAGKTDIGYDLADAAHNEDDGEMARSTNMMVMNVEEESLTHRLDISPGTIPFGAILARSVPGAAVPENALFWVHHRRLADHDDTFNAPLFVGTC